MRRDALHPSVLDAEFFLKKGDLAIPAVDLSAEPDLTILTVGRPGQEHREGVVAEGQDMEDRGLRPPVPAARQGDLMVHQDLRELSLIREISEILDLMTSVERG